MSTSPTPPPPLPVTGDATGGLIPYKNPRALTGYYLGVFSLIPALGLLLGPCAIWLGFAGLRACRAQPAIHGKVHSIVAITLGSLVLLGHLALIAMILAES